MNWDAIAAVGQAVGALALVFVFMQLRHAREEMQRATVLTRLEGTRDLFLAQATDEGLASVMGRVQASTGAQTPVNKYLMEDLGLSSSEARRFGAYCMAAWHNFEVSIESIDRLSPGVRWEVDTTIRANYGTGSLARWFEIRKSGLNPNAVRYVENLLAQPG